jgi:hypothetical protein
VELLAKGFCESGGVSLSSLFIGRNDIESSLFLAQTMVA